MTRDRRFKQAVRKLMRATGQNYLSARASLQPHESADGGEEAGSMPTSTKEGLDDIRYEVILKGEHDLVIAYLSEIRKFPTVTDVEAMQLGQQKEAGELADWYRMDWSSLSEAEAKTRAEAARNGRLARKRLTEAHLDLVVSIARRYQGQGLGLLALIEAGNRGLVRAVDKFEGKSEQPARLIAGTAPEERGFSAFARLWIVAGIHRALDVANNPRIPRYGEAKNNADVQKLHDVLEELPQRLGREPTVDEVANDLGFTPERARRYASIMVATLDVDPDERDVERAERAMQVLDAPKSKQ